MATFNFDLCELPPEAHHVAVHHVDAPGADAADALAVAICHAHHVGTRQAWAGRAALGIGR